MRWMWIDRVLELVPGERMVAIKNISLAEEHLREHFAADAERGLPACPVMPASLIVEGMAQTSGILVGQAGAFREKVVLAKISVARIDRDAFPGDTLRYTATIERMDEAGASTRGVIERLDLNGQSEPEQIGQVDLMFSHVDRNRSGLAFPEHNFVFGESFRMLLESSGFAME